MHKAIQPLTLIDGTNAFSSVGVMVDSLHPGPTLVVTGDSSAVQEVYDRITALPSIAHLRGRLAMVFIDRLGSDSTLPPSVSERVGHIDDSLFLPSLPQNATAPEAQTRAKVEDYWTILAKMSGLGMISGRGVSSRRIAAFSPELRA
jgi:hypothetical protein